jgi:dipeptidase
MCDTLVALPVFTKSNSLIFGKNSDREPLEAQSILHVPKKFPKKKTLQCTFIQIPQAEETHEVLLSKPFQMWGAEMGANEYGVVIGNEAVFTNVKFQKKTIGLTGMDLVRLALERSKKAMEALICITDLLAKYGQNACGGYQNKSFFYHNSFLIADHEDAFVLETAGKSWAYRRVQETSSISNALSINENFEGIHLEKEERNVQGIFRKRGTDFSKNFSDLLYTKIGKGTKRQTCTLEYIKSTKGSTEVPNFFDVLRLHNLPEGKFAPQKANTESICMHATGLTNPSNTTGSMVAEIRKNQAHTIWFSATSHPCMSIYLPFFFGNQELASTFSPTANPDQSIWWSAFQLHKWISEDYSNRQPIIRSELDEIQKIWINQEKTLLSYHPFNTDLLDFSRSCVDQYSHWLKEKLQKITQN